jgi:hypothetical protein
MWSFLRWGVVLVALGWVAVTVAATGLTYFATETMLDTVLRDVSARHRSILASGESGAYSTVAADLRRSLVRTAHADGLPFDESNFRVSVNSKGIAATVQWSSPGLTYGGREILVMPLSIQRVLIP